MQQCVGVGKLARKGDSLVFEIFELLLQLPWWVSVLFSAFVYFTLAIAVPSIEFDSTLFQGMSNTFSSFAHWIALFFLMAAPISVFHTSRKRALLENQRGIDSIKALDWKAFEELVGEAYRRSGYQVVENSKTGADGGVDLRLRKGDKTTLVQCKQWRSQSVGVKIVREMYGILADEQAQQVFIVCTGSFTKDAEKFASDKPIKLITGDELQQLVPSVQSSSGKSQENPASQVSQTPNSVSKPPVCPRCDSILVLRAAKRGANAGKEFYGCGSFPKCRYTKAV
jgi:restriction system protein